MPHKTRSLITLSNDPQIDSSALTLAGKVANQHAARGVFGDYLARKADNTIRRQAADIARLADFLKSGG